MQPLLKVDRLSKHFSGLVAVFNLDFEVQPGIIKAVIGPNGAGKTTLINLLTGFLQPTDGRISFLGRPTRGLKPHDLAALGMSRTFQTVELFTRLTALENVMAGCHLRGRRGMLASMLRVPGVGREERELRRRGLELLEMVDLSESAGKPAGELPLGDQKLLEVARALAAGPRLLLLDEPAAGLNDKETREAADMILRIKQSGTTIILVEHDMKMVMSISDEVLVLNFGAKIAEGPPQAVKQDPAVIEAYLGGE